MSELGDKLNWISEAIIGCAIEVHRELGPGLLESAYDGCLEWEMLQRGIRVERQKPLPLAYKGTRIDVGYRIDLLVEDLVVVELKAVDRLESIHEAQLLSYLKLTGCHLGLLVNFNVLVLKSGIRRRVNQFPD